MKFKNITPRFVAGALGTTLLLATVIWAGAQPRPERPSRDAPLAKDRPGYQPRSAGKSDPFQPGRPSPPGSLRGRADAFRNLGLKDEQRLAVREILGDARQRGMILSERLRLARMELSYAANSDQANEEAIRDRANTIGKIAGEMALLRVKTLSRLRELLSPDQYRRIKPMLREWGANPRGRGPDGPTPAPQARPPRFSSSERPAAPPVPPRHWPSRPDRRGQGDRPPLPF